ncbi:MAG: glycoside hydrolase family 3 C-terminal domain-containing protein [Cellvibrionaceae bacterium]|nr:glycoside hydrolase family 3 C-terminal domain-containing protein [Cellvibrionaceae bacterium]
MFPKISFEHAATWAEEILAQMTLQEKCAYIGGVDIFFIKGIERLGLPRILCSDATAGITLRERFNEVTFQYPVPTSVAFPAPLMLAATWNTDLVEAFATAVGEECNANGIGILLGPGFNLYRVAQCGRNFEYFGEDPFLISRMIERYVVGVQNTGTIATLKHFVANNTDYFRRKSNSIVDERTLREIYLPAFKAGIDAGALAVMTAYNLLNGEWTGQSKAVIHDLLRNTLGFRWLVMTDWWSVYDGAKLVESGQDLEMPGNLATLGLEEKIQNGEVQESDLDRMVKSILTTLKAMELYDKKPQPELIHKYPEHEKIALQTAREGVVMLRNQNQILPLDKSSPDEILLLGPYIHKKAVGDGSSEVKGYNQVTLYQALHKIFGERTRYEASPTDDMIRSAKRIILAVGTQDAESWDRPFELDPQEELYARHITRLNPNVIVLVNSGSGIRMTGWYQQAAAILYCFYNGQNGHTAVAEILTGDVNPSGKLPFTIEREFSDGPGANYVPAGEVLYNGANDDWEKIHPVYDVEYKEGVFVGYRWYDSRNIEPLYPFGFGLSYTQFSYSDLVVIPPKSGESHVEVRFRVSNTGNVAGQEIAQVYVRDLHSSEPRPFKELKGFRKISLAPGEQTGLQFELPSSAFAFWSTKVDNWLVEPGDFEILVGSSSRDIRLKSQLNLN